MNGANWLIALGAGAVALVLLAACGGPPAGTGDPGNHRLNQLARDAIFSDLPPGAQIVGQPVKTPKAWRDNGLFEPSGWDGFNVQEKLRADDPDAVFAYYAARAQQEGWVDNGNRKRC